MSEIDIVTASRRLGRLRVDADGVRGEGGVFNPTLVVPVSIDLQPLPQEQRVVVTEARAELSLAAGTALPGTRLGAGARARGAGGVNHLWASHQTGSTTHITELRFALTPAQMQALEAVGGGEQAAVFFGLRFELEIAWLRSEQAMHESPIGLAAFELWPIAHVPAMDLTMSISRSHWADTILPALGGSRLRLVTVRLPAPGRLPGDVVAWYDEARLKLDRGDYRGAVERARDVRYAVERHFEATRSEPVATKLALVQGIDPQSPAVMFLDGLWRSLAEVTNDARHPEGPGPRIRGHDARAVLLVTATALEYIQSVLDAAS